MSLSKSSVRNWLPIFGLTCAVFIFNTSEFVPIALLTDIAADFKVTEASAGMIISVYAWAVTLLSLPLMVIASRMEMRRLMLWLIGTFSLFQFLSSVAGGYWMLMFSRLGVACTHSVFWAIVSPIAVRIVADKYRQVALSMIATGSSVAMIVGLPLGRVIGLHVGWRMTFLSIGAFAVATFIYLISMLPKVPSEGGFPPKKVPGLFKSPLLAGLYVMSLMVATAYYTGYSYIEPFLLQVAKLHSSWITVILMLFGGAGILGSIIFTKCYRGNQLAFLTVVIFCMMACLALLLPTSVNAVAISGLCVVWGMAATTFNVAMQSEVINCSPREATSVSMAIFSGIFNMGIASGTMIGGAICTYSSILNIGIAGGIIALAAFVFWLRFERGKLKAWYAKTKV